MSRTWASCDADSGSGLRDGTPRRSGLGVSAMAAMVLAVDGGGGRQRWCTDEAGLMSGSILTAWGLGAVGGASDSGLRTFG